MMHLENGIQVETKDGLDYKKYFQKNQNYNPYSFDSIKLTDAEANRLVKTISDTPDRGGEYLENPALDDFSVIITLSDGDECTIVFHKTGWEKDCFPELPYEGSQCKIIPVCDFFYSFTGNKNFDFASTVSMVRRTDDETGQESLFSLDFPILIYHYTDPKLFTNDDYEQCSFQARLLYIAILKILKERPSVFYQSGTRQYTTPKISKKDKRNHRNRVKAVKYISLNEEELDDYIKGHREFTCLCWGVMGHFRTYKKSGTTVWVKPHRKGKLRNNPDAFIAKDYELVTAEGEAI